MTDFARGISSLRILLCGPGNPFTTSLCTQGKAPIETSDD
jgi:hypothetical protein